MKEIIALHEAILALELDFPSGMGVDFSRDEISDEIELLPDALQAEIRSLQEAIDAVLPEDFDCFAFLAFPDQPAAFSLEFDRLPVGSEFLPERPLIEQLREVNWEEHRAKGRETREQIDGIFRMQKLMTGALRSAKALQREFREETKDFIKEKRKDAARIHVMYWDDAEGVMETVFEDGAALRGTLPGLVAAGSEVITIVAGGKPLPVERIDALLREAQKTLRAEIAAKAKEIAEAEPEDGEPPESAGETPGPEDPETTGP